MALLLPPGYKGNITLKTYATFLCIFKRRLSMRLNPQKSINSISPAVKLSCAIFNCFFAFSCICLAISNCAVSTSNSCSASCNFSNKLLCICSLLASAAINSRFAAATLEQYRHSPKRYVHIKSNTINYVVFSRASFRYPAYCHGRLPWPLCLKPFHLCFFRAIVELIANRLGCASLILFSLLFLH